MRKLIVVENLSLDGVMEAPEKWAFAHQNAEMAKANQEGMNESDALLLGRKTYEEFAAFWPSQAHDEAGIGGYINKVAKFVVSSTLQKAEWNNTTIIRGNAIDEIRKLKQQSGKNITVVGSGVLVQSLMQANLIDEYNISLIPIVLGGGQQLFPTGTDNQALQLIEAKPFATGLVLLRYQPATQ